MILKEIKFTLTFSTTTFYYGNNQEDIIKMGATFCYLWHITDRQINQQRLSKNVCKVKILSCKAKACKQDKQSKGELSWLST